MIIQQESEVANNDFKLTKPVTYQVSAEQASKIAEEKFPQFFIGKESIKHALVFSFRDTMRRKDPKLQGNVACPEVLPLSMLHYCINGKIWMIR